MTLVFDTTALSHFLDEDQAILKVVASKEFDQYIIPLATDAEIRFGFMHGSRQSDNLAKYAHVVQKLSFELAYPNQDTSIIYAELAAWAKEHGVALSINDIWIAAASRQLGGKLLTLDGDFKHLPQISHADLG
jgi:predicted nucleic acid-binding protein